ncbi:hypothetical protein B0H12DRAFT_1099298 [Mycena haematopus]|nr:hypothetical protein B0H12DRAFT_1099298 [Mycena haematopus]
MIAARPPEFVSFLKRICVGGHSREYRFVKYCCAQVNRRRAPPKERGLGNFSFNMLAGKESLKLQCSMIRLDHPGVLSSLSRPLTMPARPFRRPFFTPDVLDQRSNHPCGSHWSSGTLSIGHAVNPPRLRGCQSWRQRPAVSIRDVSLLSKPPAFSSASIRFLPLQPRFCLLALDSLWAKKWQEPAGEGL